MTEEKKVEKVSEETVAEKKSTKKEELKARENVNIFEWDLSDAKVSIEDMFKNGVHFGHSKSRRNPRMDKFIFGTKKNINIIDLQKTEEKLKKALAFIEETVSTEKDILFIGIKKQANPLVRILADKCGMPFVVERWIGGTFTNFGEIKKRTRFLKESQNQLERGEFEKYTKLEKLKKTEELEKLEGRMGGIKDMVNLPGAIFVTDIKMDKLAIEEAKKMNIPIIALADTNTNPYGIDFPIPANDDAVSSLKLMLGYVGNAILEARK